MLIVKMFTGNPPMDPLSAIISNIQNLVNQRLEVQVPISGTTYESFTGTGYIAMGVLGAHEAVLSWLFVFS